MIRKLKNNKGESIAEILLAILVSVMGITLLAIMIQTSSKLILSSSERIKAYSEDERKIVSRANSDDVADANLWVDEETPKPVAIYKGCGQLKAKIYEIEFGNLKIITFEKTE